MNDQIFFADVALPFHFWVRERSGAKGMRWVLREASHLRQEARGAPTATSPEPPATAPGAE